jgi:regulator of sirC expression with transglutaminase-like and TPR domain
MSRPDESIDIAEAALLIAKEEYPDLDVGAYLGRLDDMAAEVRARMPDPGDSRQVVATLNNVLFQSQGFHGNTENYYDLRNSFLNEVLDRHTGIPITLSAVYLAVGRRAGVALHGVGMPGHFLVKHVAAESEELVIDPFNAGAILLPEDCQRILDRLFEGRLRLEPGHLQVIGTRQTLARMLRNLKAIYFGAHQYGKALSVVDRLLILDPGCPSEIRDRGLLFCQIKEYRRAAENLERYLRLCPGAEDSDVIRSHLRSLRERLVGLN